MAPVDQDATPDLEPVFGGRFIENGWWLFPRATMYDGCERCDNAGERERGRDGEKESLKARRIESGMEPCSTVCL